MANPVNVNKTLSVTLLGFSLVLNGECQIPLCIQPWVPDFACKLADPDTWRHTNVASVQNICPMPSSPSSFHEIESQGIGSISGENVSITTHLGPLSLSMSTIKNSLSVQGPCTAHNTDFKGGLTVSGPTTIKGKKHTVGGPVAIQGGLWTDGMIYADTLDIVGYLEAKNCEFNKMITIKTTRITLENCIINNSILIDDRDDHPATIILENCTLHGTIMFKSSQGIVQNKNSNVTQKNIIGALIHLH